MNTTCGRASAPLLPQILAFDRPILSQALDSLRSNFHTDPEADDRRSWLTFQAQISLHYPPTMASLTLTTPLTSLLHITHPILLAGMARMSHLALSLHPMSHQGSSIFICRLVPSLLSKAALYRRQD